MKAKYKANGFIFLGLFVLAIATSCHVWSGEQDVADATPTRRIPAEWEPQAAVWMQWPSLEEQALRPEFAQIINVIQTYEPVQLLTGTRAERVAAEGFLADRGVPDTHVTWHVVPIDNAWMRDNGPIYATNDRDTWIENWDFNGWDGAEGALYDRDNLVPDRVAKILKLEVEDYTDYILEKGNLEVNGEGIALIGWDCQDRRNPGMGRAEHEAILKPALGLTDIVWAYGHDPEDITTGHIDGTARFIDADTVVVADYYASETEQNLALDLEDMGFEVVRYPGDPNWLVGNGFVAAMGSGDRTTDSELKSQLQELFPSRKIHMLDVKALEASGGGIHCVTNDQPVLQ